MRNKFYDVDACIVTIQAGPIDEAEAAGDAAL
jgi:hypothetical protein